MARTYKTTHWRLVRPEGMTDADWKAFRKVHGYKSGEGRYIFGVPRGTGKLQEAANDPGMSSHKDGHFVDWKTDSTVAPSIKENRGDLTNKATKAMMFANSKSGKTISPHEIREQLRKSYYQVQYGPDGRAK